IENIKPPVRLSFSPYFSTSINHYDHADPKTKTTISGGMDVKYGINQAFTLDMTLIPDFGQVQSDNQVLNLSPFEVKFNENRSFFTEGTELFGKGNLFYSRRIGARPINFRNPYSNTGSNEKVIENPVETKLINAFKISGRTSSGLGMGFFNAITRPEYAIIQDTLTKFTRKEETSPLTNYNIMVFDQTLKNKSSISLINTNVLRSGSTYDANVTAGLWDFYDKKTIWNFGGKVSVSQLMGEERSNGYLHSLYFGKVGGNFNFNFSQDIADKKYNSNDLGYFTNNNFLDHSLWVGYKWLKPKSWYNSLYYNFNTGYSMRFAPRDYQNFWLNTNLNGTFKNLNYFGIAFNLNPEENDFYEARMNGKVFKRPGSFAPGLWYGTNSAKKLFIYTELFWRFTPKYKGDAYDATFQITYRVNKKFSVSLSTYSEVRNRNLGFAGILNDVNGNDSAVIIGSRRIRSVDNVLNLKYNFNNKMGITLRARHYWSKVKHQQFFDLQDDGYVKASNANINPDIEVNFFNIDMVYTWQFAQGSFINIVWKNSIQAFDDKIDNNYMKNLGNTLGSAQNNNLSLRVIYFLDYLKLKRHRS
ncbi:MAG: DUF5916 domain-containing protein, partial [Bacteroidota bacterium]